MRILVIGAGGVGAAAAAVAQRRDFFERFVLADVDAARAQAAADQTGDPRFGAAAVDASDAAAIAELARSEGADAILNAVDPRFNPAIFAAAFDAGCTYLDMAMTLSEPHPERPYEEVGVKLGDAQFADEERWREAGRLALVGIGIEPGLCERVRPLRAGRALRRRSTRSGSATAPTSSSRATTSRRRSRSGRRSRSA